MMNKTSCGSVVGIDIGGTKVCIGLVGEDGRLLHSTRYQTHRDGFAAFAAGLGKRLEAFFAEHPEAQAAKGIGIGIKGFVNYQTQMLNQSSLFGGESGPLDLCGPLQKQFNLPAVIDNDVHAGTLAELRFGVGQTKDDFVFINVGTGTAMGAVVNRWLVRGAANRAGEVGLTLLRRPGETATYRMEDIASGAGIDLETRRLAPQMPNSALARQIAAGSAPLRLQALLDAAEENDPLAAGVLANLLDALCLTLYNLQFIFDSGMYVFGGGMAANSWLLGAVRERLEVLCRQNGEPWTAELSVSRLGADSIGVVGAAALYWDACENTMLPLHAKGGETQ